MTDIFLESDTFYLFQPPVFYRMPSNTDEVYSDYINNPNSYANNQIPREYILQRQFDIQRDLRDVESAGMSENNAKKVYFYRGFLTSLNNLLLEMDENKVDYIFQSRVLEVRNGIQTFLDNIRLSGMTTENGMKYNYHKGRLTAYEQILLNSELVRA
jgi:hypothetical protein